MDTVIVGYGPIEYKIGDLVSYGNKSKSRRGVVIKVYKDNGVPIAEVKRLSFLSLFIARMIKFFK